MQPRLFHANLCLAAALIFISCRQHEVASAAPAPLSANPIADIPAPELRDILADLARAHEQKIQLAWYVSTPLRSIDPPFKPFYTKMGEQQKTLLTSLQSWAKDNKIDLAYHPTTDTLGRAQKIMEDRQEKLVRGDDKPNFERDNLIQMFTDYEWQVAEIQALLPKVKDPALKDYLEKSLKIHEEGSAEIAALLKRFKFVT